MRHDRQDGDGGQVERGGMVERGRRGDLRGRTPSDWFRVSLLAGSAVALIGIAFAAARVGPWIGRDVTTDPPASLPSLPSLPTLPTLPTLPSVSPPSGGSSFDPTWLLIGLGVVLVLALLAMGLAWWRERNRRPEHADLPGKPERPQALPEIPGGDLPFDRRATADYVISCWQQVESAAAAAGIPRNRQQTPTEFLAAVAAVHPIDPAASDALLGLYHHARFDHVALGPDSAELARASTETICGDLPARFPEYR